MNKFLKKISVLLCASMIAGSVSIAGSAANSAVIEAENGTFSGDTSVLSSASGYSGKGYVGDFSGSGTLRFEFDISTDGRYDISLTAGGTGTETFAKINIDSDYSTTVSVGKSGWKSSTVHSVYMSKGKHRIRITKDSGAGMLVDKIEIKESTGVDSDVYQLNYRLSNPNANDDAKRLFRFMLDNYGKNVISGQYTDNGKGVKSPEYKAILNGTGEAPAILGFDMMEYSPSRLPFLGGYETLSITENAIEWAKEYGGIVTYCWHWTPAKEYLGKNSKPWYSGFYTDATTFDIKAAMSGEDEFGYNSLIKDIDAIAVELQKLEDAGVPVLWRPLHEASGGWFWWGTDRDSCIELWRLMYERLTYHHGLDNLIWVWNGQKTDWYPGDEYVDIIGEDIYAENHDTSSQAERFYRALEDSPNKMICLSENGVIPDIDSLTDDNVMWSWFGTWNGSFIQKNSQLSGTSTPVETIKKIYQSDRVITLDELPDWSEYPTGDYEGEAIKGDVNINGIVDILDVILLRGNIVGTLTLSSEQFANADMNDDGETTILDVVIIRDIIVNK